MLRVSDHGFKVDYAIERMTGANPLIHCDPSGFCLRGISALTFPRNESSSKNLEMISVCPSNQLFETTDNLFGSHRLFRFIVGGGMRDIIDAFENN